MTKRLLRAFLASTDGTLFLPSGSAGLRDTLTVDDAVVPEALWAERGDEPRLLFLPSVSVVIPALNEEANIGWVLRRMPAWVEEVIVVDGGSHDHTVDVARALWPGVVVITELRKGKGAALRAGFAAATCEVIVMIDADGSMDPAETEAYVRVIDEGGYDLVKGSRTQPGGGSADLTLPRRLGNSVLRSLVNVLYSVDLSELCYGFMALRRTTVPLLELSSDGFEIETEIVVQSLRRGLSIAEIPSREAERLNGRSHLRPIRDGFRVLSTIVRLLSWDTSPPGPGSERRHRQPPSLRLQPLWINTEKIVH